MTSTKTLLNGAAHFAAAMLALTGTIFAAAPAETQTSGTCASACSCAAATCEPARADVLAVMRKVADWQIANPYNPDSKKVHESTIPPTGWVQAAGYTGIMALAELADEARYYDAMRKIADANKWKLRTRASGFYDADDHCMAQIYAELYLKYRDSKMLASMQKQFDEILATPAGSSLKFDQKTNPGFRNRWSWCDSLFMGPPGWIRLYAATGNKAYRDFAVGEWWKTSTHLYDKAAHLYFRDDRFTGTGAGGPGTGDDVSREANGQKVFWGRGNGWVMGGLVRVLQFLPKDDPARPNFENQFKEMAAAVLACQQPDGLWRASLLDPASYPLKETSGSGFFCYAFTWGINNGLLDRATYEPSVMKCWSAMVACVTPEGKITHVQPVGFDPKQFPDNSTEAYGSGAFLLAGSEMCRLLKK